MFLTKENLKKHPLKQGDLVQLTGGNEKFISMFDRFDNEINLKRESVVLVISYTPTEEEYFLVEVLHNKTIGQIEIHHADILL